MSAQDLIRTHDLGPHREDQDSGPYEFLGPRILWGPRNLIICYYEESGTNENVGVYENTGDPIYTRQGPLGTKDPRP